MIKAETSFWQNMRRYYLPYGNCDHTQPSFPKHLRKLTSRQISELKGNEAIVPYIEHTRFSGFQKPHDTGIIVHLVANNALYHKISQEDYKMAKYACKYLVKRSQELLKDAQENISDKTEPWESRAELLGKRTHEFYAIRHHYQLNFKNRSFEDYTR